MTDLTREGLVELAERCEQASGPNRGLDLAIALMLGERGLNGSINISKPRTASLDAAMTLVDGVGVLMALSDIGADGLPLARVARPDIDGGPICSGIASCIMTDTAPVAGLAIAVCAAALRARAMEAGCG